MVCAAFLDLRKAFDSLDHVQELGVHNVTITRELSVVIYFQIGGLLREVSLRGVCWDRYYF